MAMKFLTFDDQAVANSSPHDKENNGVTFDIIQDAQCTNTQLILSKRIGPQSFDCLGRRRGLVCQPSLDSGLQDSLLASTQRL
jgi:hypothetical protein